MTTRYQKPSLWYKAEAHDVPRLLFDFVEGVEREQSAIFEGHVQHAKLYAGLDLIGFRREGSTNYTRRPMSSICENVIRSVVDTAASLIAKNQVRPTCQTEDGDWDIQNRAALLGPYMDGVLRDVKYHRESVRVFKDAAIYGTGALKVIAHADRIGAERVLIDEIVVDEAECPSGGLPQKLAHRMFADRDQLLAMYPEHAAEIEAATCRSAWAGYRDTSERIVVIEAWKRPSAPGAGDGRRVIAIENAVLLDEEWCFDFFPFAFYRWEELGVGFYGQGLVEQLAGLQYELNRVTLFINTCQRLIANPKIFLDVASKIMLSSLESNKIGQIIPFRGKPPIFLSPQAVGQEIYTYQQGLRQRMYELAGISGYSARGSVPAGFESAAAQRELQQRDAGRFVIQELQFEDLCMDAADLILSLSKALYTATDGEVPLKVQVSVGGILETIDWKKVDMDRDRFQMSVEPVSILSKTPAARKQEAIELGQAGLISTDAAARLMKHPDIPYEMSMETANIEAIERVIKALRNGDMIPPDPIMDLDLGIKRMSRAYILARTSRNVPETVLEDMRAWIDMARDQIKTSQAPPAAMPGAPMDPGMAPAPVTLPTDTGPQAAFAEQAMQLQSTGIPA